MFGALSTQLMVMKALQRNVQMFSMLCRRVTDHKVVIQYTSTHLPTKRLEMSLMTA